MTGGPGMSVTASIDINAWQNEMFTLNLGIRPVNNLFCLFDVSIFVGSIILVSGKEYVSASDAMVIAWHCRLLGQGQIGGSADVLIFRGISFSLALRWCDVSTVLNPVPLANLNRLQPIAAGS